MGLLNRLFGGKKATPGSIPEPEHHKVDEDAQTGTVGDIECPHTDLDPYVTNEVNVVGQTTEVSGYQCRGCGRIFSPAEAVALREQQGKTRPSQPE
jgi:hypothetical protein